MMFRRERTVHYWEQGPYYQRKCRTSQTFSEILRFIRRTHYGVTDKELHEVFPRKRIEQHLANLEAGYFIWSDSEGTWFADPDFSKDSDIAYNDLAEDPSSVIVFDTETTGLNEYRNDEILQLSIIDGNGSTLFDKHFRPSDKMMERGWSDAEKVHGILREDVRDLEPISERDIHEVNEIFSRSKAQISYNYPYDGRILVDEGFSPVPKPAIDVMLDFAPVYGEWVEWAQDFKWQKLTTAAKYVGYEFRAHDSLEDCRATLEVAKYLLEHGASSDHNYVDEGAEE